MRASPHHYEHLLSEARRLADQLRALGAIRVVLFGSLVRGTPSLFSDFDPLALFEDPRSPRELTRWVYSVIDSSESVDIFCIQQRRFRPSPTASLLETRTAHAQVLYERPAT